jgi:hypothetical protein
MEVSTFHKTLCHQTEFAQGTIVISVEGIGGLEFEINHQGSLVSLSNLVKKLKSDAGKLLISGIKPMKFTNDSGCYLFLTQNDVANEAEKKLNNLFETLASAGQLNTFGIKGKFIHCINQIQLKQVTAHANSLKNKYAPPVASNSPGPGPVSDTFLQPLELNCHFQVQSLEFPQDG